MLNKHLWVNVGLTKIMEQVKQGQEGSILFGLR